MALTDILKLNIRGKLVLTSRANFFSEPSSVFAQMFGPDQRLSPTAMVDGAHFIDADPDCFQVILNWLTYRRILLPRNLTPESVGVVAEFYGLVDLCKELEISTRQIKMKSKLEVKRYSESLLSENRWGLRKNYNLKTLTLTQNKDLDLIGISDDKIRYFSPNLRVEGTNIFVLTLDPTEKVTWRMCKGGEVPENGLSYSPHEELYLAYREMQTLEGRDDECRIVVKGMGLGISWTEEEVLQELIPQDSDETYFVLCIHKM